MLLARMRKIVLQQYLPITDIRRLSFPKNYIRALLMPENGPVPEGIVTHPVEQEMFRALTD